MTKANQLSWQLIITQRTETDETRVALRVLFICVIWIICSISAV